MRKIGLRRGSLAAVAAACATALTVAACSSGSSSASSPSAGGTSSGSASAPAGGSSSASASSTASLPTVSMMVGGIDKQIYLPYQLAQSLGFYKKYGVNMVLSTEQSGGVGAEDAVASGQVNLAGAWYVHTINFQLKGKAVEDVVQLSGAPPPARTSPPPPTGRDSRSVSPTSGPAPTSSPSTWAPGTA